MFLSIVIAIYNEQGNVKELTERIYSSMDKLDVPFELIYVIDGKDQSFEIIKEIQKTKSNLILDHSPNLRGFKNAFVKGFQLINPSATHILTLDGDLNHRPEEIKNLLSAMEQKHADLVVGSRYTSGGQVKRLAFWKRAVSTFANFVIELLWKIKLKDKTSGYRLYKKEVIEKTVPLCTSGGFEFLFEIILLSRRFNYKINEVPIIFITREHGESKFNLFRTISGYLGLMRKYFLK
jgi:dolichol-phosphate mannosyltransferase